MDYWDIKRRVNKLIVEELEIELNRKIYLIARYLIEQLGREGNDLVDYLVREDAYFLEELIEIDIKGLSSKGKLAYDNVINYLLEEDNTVEEEMSQEALKRAIEVSEELFREELEDRYRET
ncbi:hypothetical protein NG799_15755 [Laspinema sp. D1]|uniref:Uncharacterized protein n=1 Tax=Laspinema palackyanum D2a TaxID=2953684 RepID=A0ABT2MSU4_9CYAN|nr:hypothetical protein [Laspinema sp. D2a]